MRAWAQMEGGNPARARAEQLVEQHDVPDGTGDMVTADTITDGLELYIQDRLARQKPLTEDEMQGFFSGRKVRFSNRVYKVHVPFFTKLAQDNRTIHVIKGALLQQQPQGLAGNSGATVIRIATKKLLGLVQGPTLYLKRSSGNKAALMGKKIAAEVAAYKLSKLLGLDIVPLTRIVKFNKLIYSGQDAIPATFVQGATTTLSEDVIRSLLVQSTWQEALSELLLFDYLGSFVDRHPANIFFDLTKHKLKAIDHDMGFTFVLPVVPPNRRFLSGGRLPAVYSLNLQRKVQALGITKLQQKLGKLLPGDTIEAIWLRVKIVQADIARKCAAP